MNLMKKFIYIIFTSCLLFTLGSCSDILDHKPKDILTDELVWQDPNAIKAYLGRMYDRMDVESGSLTTLDEAGYSSTLTDEAVRSYGWGRINDPIVSEEAFPCWKYDAVREANIFLDRIATSSVISEKERVEYVAEARFIRAFYYFSMVKRYGGIPIVKDVQEATAGNIPKLQVPRNTEKEVYDFIREELDAITKDETGLPTKWNAANRFRATRYAGLALKSRAMLYAASIAKYGQVSLNGLVGIPKTDMEFYYKESISASKGIMDSGDFYLYEEDADKEKNFQGMFLNKTMHSEAIFKKAFEAPNKGHSFDFYNAPQSFRVDYGCVTNPVMDLVEDFEYIDGTSGELKLQDAAGNDIKYDNPYDLFKNKDPRFLASVLVPFASWQNGILEIRKGIFANGQYITASNLTDLYPASVEGQPKPPHQITIIGKDGTLNVNDPTKTGFYIKKFMNPTDRVLDGRSDTHYLVFRYAEVLLNYAEACVEINQNAGDALTQINKIRQRAGIADLTSLDIAKVRKERRVELAFEDHRWWDMRRWRIATDVLDNRKFYALFPYLVWEDGKDPKEMKYIFKKEKAEKESKTFLPKLYYVKIAANDITSNPKLEQNPGY